MYHATDSQSLHYMDPLVRYESEEEDVSESDNAFSPVPSQRTPETRAPSDVSADESNISEGDTIRRLLSPYSPDSAARPVSIGTAKRSSGATATFIGDSFLDRGDLWPPKGLSRSESGASASVFYDEEFDLLVAEQVIYIEPHSRPNVIKISPPAAEPEVSKRRSRETRYAYRNSAVNSMGEVEIPWQTSTDDTRSLRDISESRGPPARPVLRAINTAIPNSKELSQKAIPKQTVSGDIAPLHPLPPSFSRPFPDKNTRRRLPSDASQRPRSTYSASSANLYPSATKPSPYPNDDSPDKPYVPLNLQRTTSNSSSKVAYYSSPTFYPERKDSWSTTPALAPNAVKHSATSSVSVSSLSDRAVEAQGGKSLKGKITRVKSLRQMRRNRGEGDTTERSPSESAVSPSSSVKGFGLGFGKLGRRKTTLTK